MDYFSFNSAMWPSLLSLRKETSMNSPSHSYLQSTIHLLCGCLYSWMVERWNHRQAGSGNLRIEEDGR
jgi:hypothetical protein